MSNMFGAGGGGAFGGGLGRGCSASFGAQPANDGMFGGGGVGRGSSSSFGGGGGDGRATPPFG